MTPRCGSGISRPAKAEKEPANRYEWPCPGDLLHMDTSRYARFLRPGHRVTGDNHVGDWGTQFGMIIYGYKHFLDKAAYDRDPVGELARLYRLVNQLADYHDAVAEIPKLKLALADRQAARLPAILRELSRIGVKKGEKRL